MTSWTVAIVVLHFGGIFLWAPMSMHSHFHKPVTFPKYTSARSRCFRLSTVLCALASFLAQSVAYIRRRPIVEKTGKITEHCDSSKQLVFESIEAQHGRFKGRSHRSFSITRDFQATVFFGCHGNSDVLFEKKIIDFTFFFEISVYFIKTKTHICIHELACQSLYFVSFFFREISLKREEQQ